MEISRSRMDGGVATAGKARGGGRGGLAGMVPSAAAGPLRRCARAPPHVWTHVWMVWRLP
eukprot:363853-Chlamydomonas_euryale.AAC.2